MWSWVGGAFKGGVGPIVINSIAIEQIIVGKLRDTLEIYFSPLDTSCRQIRKNLASTNEVPKVAGRRICHYCNEKTN